MRCSPILPRPQSHHNPRYHDDYPVGPLDDEDGEQYSLFDSDDYPSPLTQVITDDEEEESESEPDEEELVAILGLIKASKRAKKVEDDEYKE